MGTVYLAEDRLLGRTVALKVPRFHEPDHSGLVQRFYREARIAATFNHENLCRVYDVGHAEGRHYFTMPVLSGKPLSASLNREGPLPEREAARLTSLLAHAMQEAHRLGVIHRDLKPSNVMISENGSPIVMDFGLAHRAADQDPRLTPAGTFMGTPLYVAPEQIGGGPERPSVAGDVYSLGIMFYEMLTGRAPFQGDVNEVLRQVLTGVSDPPSRFRPSLDRRLDAICMSAIEKAPEARFRSMAEFAKALEDYLQADDAVTTHEDARIVRPSPKPSPPVTGATLPTSARRARRRRALAVGLFALVTLPILIVIAAQRYLGSNTDLLQPGTRWSGDVEFAQPFARISDYHIQIKSRHGKSFEALCEGENGEYQWVIAGTIEDGTIRWRFKKVLREAMWTGVVEGASVVGHYRDKAIVATFRDANSSATLKLTLVE
jgi:serine/threonine protein kinase